MLMNWDSAGNMGGHVDEWRPCDAWWGNRQDFPDPVGSRMRRCVVILYLHRTEIVDRKLVIRGYGQLATKLFF